MEEELVRYCVRCFTEVQTANIYSHCLLKTCDTAELLVTTPPPPPVAAWHMTALGGSHAEVGGAVQTPPCAPR